MMFVAITKQTMTKCVAIAILAFSFLAAIGDASSFDDPHSHTGKVTPFEPGDPKVSLDNKAVSILKSGKPFQTQIQSGAGGRGLVVQDINAPTDVVWARILDYDNYAKMVPKTVESKNYNVVDVKPTKKDPLSQIIYTRMKVGFPVLKLEFFVKHLYYPSLNSLTWTLDYTKLSDFDDSCGYWYVIPHPENPEGATRVYYSVEVSMFDWVPKFVVDFMSTKALTDATAWVKKFSELENQRNGGKQGQAVSTDGTPSTVEGKKRGFGILNFGKKKKEAQAQAEAEELARKAEEDARKAKEEEEMRLAKEKKEKEELRLSWTRTLLVSAVSALASYNIHLYLSQ